MILVVDFFSAQNFFLLMLHAPKDLREFHTLESVYEMLCRGLCYIKNSQ